MRMVLILLLPVGLLAVAIAAAVAGLWLIAAVDVLACICVILCLRALAPKKRAALTYQEIMARQRAELPPIQKPVELPTAVVTPIAFEEAAPMEAPETALAAA